MTQGIGNRMKIKNNQVKEITLNKPYKSQVSAKKRDVNDLSLIITFKRIILTGLKLSYGKLVGYQKAKNSYIFDKLI